MMLGKTSYFMRELRSGRRNLAFGRTRIGKGLKVSTAVEAKFRARYGILLKIGLQG